MGMAAVGFRFESRIECICFETCVLATTRVSLVVVIRKSTGVPCPGQESLCPSQNVTPLHCQMGISSFSFLAKQGAGAYI